MARPLPLQAVAHLTALALLPLIAASASLGWGDEVASPAPSLTSRPAGLPRTASAGRATEAFTFDTPLFDRHLSAAEKAADLAPDLLDAIMRIEPIYDPTRLAGPGSPQVMRVSAGTAAMNNVFADRWRLADLDANVDLTTTVIAIGWHATGKFPCRAFATRRATPDGDTATAALAPGECAVLLAGEARGFANPPARPIAVAAPDVPVFAAPLPGARMASAAFWAAQKARIAAIKRTLPGWGSMDQEASAKPRTSLKREARAKRAETSRVVEVDSR